MISSDKFDHKHVASKNTNSRAVTACQAYYITAIGRSAPGGRVPQPTAANSRRNRQGRAETFTYGVVARSPAARRVGRRRHRFQSECRSPRPPQGCNVRIYIDFFTNRPKTTLKCTAFCWKPPETPSTAVDARVFSSAGVLCVVYFFERRPPVLGKEGKCPEGARPWGAPPSDLAPLETRSVGPCGFFLSAA